MNVRQGMRDPVVGLAGRNGPRRGRRWRGTAVAAAALVLLAAASGCTDDPGVDSRARPAASARQAPTASAKASPTATGTVCERALAVQNSLGALTALDYTNLAEAQAAIAQVQKNLRDLRSAASAEWEKQVTALSTEVSQLGVAIGNLKGQNTSSEAWQALGAAAADVGESASDLRDSLSSSCPELQKGLDDEPGDR